MDTLINDETTGGTVVPFAADGARRPCLVTQSVAGVTYDETRQLNVMPDGGTPWHTTPQAASCTDTNQDGQGDDVDDPYFAQAS